MQANSPGEPENTYLTNEPMGAPKPAARLPAALMVLLYLVAWFGFTTVVQFILVVVYQIALVLRGGAQPNLGAMDFASPTFLALLGLTEWVSLAGTIGITWLFVGYLNRQPLVELGFRRVSGWLGHWGVGFVLEIPHMSAVVLWGLAGGYYHITGLAAPLQALAVLGVALLIALPAAAIEEVAMRGYVLQTLEQRYGTVAAVAISSVIFALLHSLNPGGTQPLSVLGLVAAGAFLSVGYLATRQLWLPIAMHTAWNVLEGPVFGLSVSGFELPVTIVRIRASGPDWLTGGTFGPEAGLPVLVTTVVWSVVVWHAARRMLAGRV